MLLKHEPMQKKNKEFGERGRNRTFNLLIKSQLLCQLSYAPSICTDPADRTRGLGGCPEVVFSVTHGCLNQGCARAPSREIPPRQSSEIQRSEIMFRWKADFNVPAAVSGMSRWWIRRLDPDRIMW